MVDEREDDLRRTNEVESDEMETGERLEQFNELSELSLEERIAVADRIGIPVHSVGEAAAAGTVAAEDEASAFDDRRGQDSESKDENR